jgi:hypothetical protein
MANSKLAFSGINGFTLFRGGSNTTTFLRIIGDTSVGDNDITNISFNSGVVGLSDIRIGQTIFGTGVGWTDNITTITAIDLGSNTITVVDAPTTSNTNKLFAVRPSKGQTFVNSGSITSALNAGVSYKNITGSQDPEYSSGDLKNNISLQLALTSSDSTTIAGQYGQYEVTEVIYRSTGGGEASFYVTASGEGILQEPDSKIPSSGNIGFPIYEVSQYGNLGPIFAPIDLEGSNVNEGAAIAAYQNAIQDYYDDLEVYIAHSGSTVAENIQFINFTGSGIQSIITSSDANGKTGVEITVQGGGGADDDWYIGDTFLTASKDIRITGSLLVTHTASNLDFFVVNSSSYEAFKINSEGITQFFAHTDTPTPWATAEYGGLYFQSSSVWAALD